MTKWHLFEPKPSSRCPQVLWHIKQVNNSWRQQQSHILPPFWIQPIINRSKCLHTAYIRSLGGFISHLALHYSGMPTSRSLFCCSEFTRWSEGSATSEHEQTAKTFREHNSSRSRHNSAACTSSSRGQTSWRSPEPGCAASDRTFHSAAPRLWNALRIRVRNTLFILREILLFF